MSDDPNDWLICTKCGKSFENWSTVGTEPCRCLKCVDSVSRRRHGGPAKKRKCILCEIEFDVPMNAGATTKYCLEHRGMATYERINAFKQKNGQYKQKYKPKEKEVDRHRYVSVVSLFGNRSIEKIVKELKDPKVVLIK